jgi:hypothetical protein
VAFAVGKNAAGNGFKILADTRTVPLACGNRVPNARRREPYNWGVNAAGYVAHGLIGISGLTSAGAQCSDGKIEQRLVKIDAGDIEFMSPSADGRGRNARPFRQQGRPFESDSSLRPRRPLSGNINNDMEDALVRKVTRHRRLDRIPGSPQGSCWLELEVDAASVDLELSLFDVKGRLGGVFPNLCIRRDSTIWQPFYSRASN